MKLINTTEAAILSALTSGEQYGLALIDRVKNISDGKVRLSLGSVYPTLHRMEDKGLVKSFWGNDDEILDGARRRYYKITGAGAKALNDLESVLLRRHEDGLSRA